MINICKNFKISSEAISCAPYGSGHINQTYLVSCQDGKRYILQKINNNIFKNIPALMQNIYLIGEHLRKKGLSEREILSIVKTNDDKLYFKNENEEYFRMYDFIENSISLDVSTSKEDFFNSAVGFGRFQSLLADFDASLLHETIAKFHDTPARFEQLKQAIAENKANRLDEVKAEIDFALAREKDAHYLMDRLNNGTLALKVTHNDTKLNNVLLDANSKKPVCIIDLDTVMPGLVANDFGDSIRFGATYALEDEEDLSKVYLSLDLFDTYAKGFLSQCVDKLSDEEIKSLAYGAKLMTLECGTRFLTDYLNGDTYFRVHKPMHNLIRCRTQFKLVKDQEENMEVMQCIINKYNCK